jgi:hypothetical protein
MFNRGNMDDEDPNGGAEQEMKVLSETRSLAYAHDEFVKRFCSKCERGV